VRVMGDLWSVERTDELRNLVALGHSGSQIATMMGNGLTRSAIIGRMNRIGIKTARAIARPTSGSRKPKKRSKREGGPKPPPQTSSTRAEMRAAAEIADSNIPMEQRRTFMGLRQGQCKYPVGDPKDPEFFFCGGLQLNGRPYCAAHCRMSYRLVVMAA
jgi:GcrA cell cycle regulator